MLGTHKNLDVWNLGMELAKNVYSITKHYPKSETFSLVNQMRRCAVSIVSNIAEGYGRGTNNELFISYMCRSVLPTNSIRNWNSPMLFPS